MTTDVRARLFAHFKESPDRAQGPKWTELWETDFVPWDRGRANPALEDTLRDQTALLGSPWTIDGSNRRRKRALVPGCGRGYDVLLLASFGYDAYGLEISPAAVEKSKEYAQAHAKDYPPRETANGSGKVGFVLGDFFSDDWFEQAGGSTFELIYDYTVRPIRYPFLLPALPLSPERPTRASPVDEDVLDDLLFSNSLGRLAIEELNFRDR